MCDEDREIPEQYCTVCKSWRPCACDDEENDRLEVEIADYRASEPWPTDAEVDEYAARVWHDTLGADWPPVGVER